MARPTYSSSTRHHRVELVGLQVAEISFMGSSGWLGIWLVD
ncbi:MULTISPECIES: hypothetical protein [Shewanella]|nr:MULTISPECIES: hypothetical protein [Shewanella]